jgi:metal-sulfur cluster biosynthetic enzyme
MAMDENQNTANDNNAQEEHRLPATTIRDQVIEALKTVYDPEIPVDIYELGLIYEVNVDKGNVHVLMTLTSPGCPAAGMLPAMWKKK